MISTLLPAPLLIVKSIAAVSEAALIQSGHLGDAWAFHWVFRESPLPGLHQPRATLNLNARFVESRQLLARLFGGVAVLGRFFGGFGDRSR